MFLVPGIKQIKMCGLKELIRAHELNFNETINHIFQDPPVPPRVCCHRSDQRFHHIFPGRFRWLFPGSIQNILIQAKKLRPLTQILTTNKMLSDPAQFTFITNSTERSVGIDCDHIRQLPGYLLRNTKIQNGIPKEFQLLTVTDTVFQPKSPSGKSLSKQVLIHELVSNNLPDLSCRRWKRKLQQIQM